MTNKTKLTKSKSGSWLNTMVTLYFYHIADHYIYVNIWRSVKCQWTLQEYILCLSVCVRRMQLKANGHISRQPVPVRRLGDCEVIAPLLIPSPSHIYHFISATPGQADLLPANPSLIHTPNNMDQTCPTCGPVASNGSNGTWQDWIRPQA